MQCAKEPASDVKCRHESQKAGSGKRRQVFEFINKDLLLG